MLAITQLIFLHNMSLFSIKYQSGRGVTVSIVAFQAIDLGSIPGVRILVVFNCSSVILYPEYESIVERIRFSPWAGWPSGPRRCVQVAVGSSRRGFESHSCQRFFSQFLLNTFFSLVRNTSMTVYIDRHTYKIMLTKDQVEEK